MTEQKPGYDPDWQTKYKNMIASAEEAIAGIRPGQRIFIGTGCGQPQELVKALIARSAELPDTEIVQLLSLGEDQYDHRTLAKRFGVVSFFIAENIRDVFEKSLGQYTPISLSEVPRLFSSGQLPLDVALIQVTPPDERGMCSLGVSVDICKSAAENARLIIAQVNPRMPRTHGATDLNVYEIDALVPADAPVLEVASFKPKTEIPAICEHIASLIQDGSTIGLGIGRISQSVMSYLKGKKDLGIHTVMLTDSVVGLVESGTVTGSRKSLDQGKIVASFCMGSRKLYDYVDGNPAFVFQPTEYVNDPFVIGQQSRMVAVNEALRIDLTGQTCVDPGRSDFFSSIGGQLDFNCGAARSDGGRAIIALSSVDENGESRIVCKLAQGAGISITRCQVHYVATEHGVAYLHGKNVQERALALISIAHPDVRSRLLHEAIDARYVRPEMASVGDKIHVSPKPLRTSMVMEDGTRVAFRSIQPTDEPLLRDLFYTLSQETIYYRFRQHLKRIPQQQMQDFVFIDHRRDAAIVATLPAAHGEDIIAVGRYYLDDATNRAEIAFVVRDDWQNKGIGTFMLHYLTGVAKANGISGFSAVVLCDNKPMQAVLQKSGCKMTSTLSEGVCTFELDFE